LQVKDFFFCFCKMWCFFLVDVSPRLLRSSLEAVHTFLRFGVVVTVDGCLQLAVGAIPLGCEFEPH